MHKLTLPRFLLLAVAILCALSPARARALDWGLPWTTHTVIGSGHLVDAPRQLGAYRRIAQSGSFDVVIQISDRSSISVHADDNIGAQIITEVSDGTLSIKLKPKTALDTRNPVVVNIMTTGLDGVALAGSGNLSLNGMRGGALDVDLVGSGNILVQGSVDQLHSALVGSGDVQMGKLISDKAQVTVTGSGKTEVQALSVLDVNITGSGTVAYSGHPKEVKRNITGSGSLAQNP